MAIFQERLKMLRKGKKLTQKQAAALFSVGERVWQAYEGGARHPTTKGLVEIANYFGVTLDYLEGRSDDPAAPAAPDRVDPVPPANGDARVLRVPVFEDFMAVCAGRGTSPVEGSTETFVDVPAWLLGGAFSTEPDKMPFIVTVRGDSMAKAKIPDGSQALVNPIQEANDGDVVVVEYYGDWMVKWIYWDRAGGGELRAASVKYPPRRFTLEDINNGNFVYIGKVVYVVNPPQRGQ